MDIEIKLSGLRVSNAKVPSSGKQQISFFHLSKKQNKSKNKNKMKEEFKS